MGLYDNPFDMRRFGQIIGNQNEPSGLMKAYRGVSFGSPTVDAEGASGAAAPSRTQQADDPIMAALSRLKGGQATDAYRAHIANLPQPGDYQPSKWRRLGAALTAGAASFGKQPQNAVALGEQIRDAPLRGALDTWKLKGAGLKEQADLEAQDVKGGLETVKQMREYLQKQKENEIAAANSQSQIAYRNAQIENFKSQGWHETYDPQGNLILMKPGEAPRNMGPSIKSTELGLQQGAAARDEKRVGYEGERVGLDRQRVGLEGQRVGLEKERVGIAGKQLGLNERNTKVNETNRGASWISPDSQNDAKTMALNTVLEKNPDWKNWVDKDGIRAPSSYWGTYNPSNDPNYKTFLAAVDAEEQRILNRRHPGGQAPMFSFGDLDK